MHKIMATGCGCVPKRPVPPLKLGSAHSPQAPPGRQGATPLRSMLQAYLSMPPLIQAYPYTTTYAAALCRHVPPPPPTSAGSGVQTIPRLWCFSIPQVVDIA